MCVGGLRFSTKLPTTVVRRFFKFAESHGVPVLWLKQFLLGRGQHGEALS